MKIIYPILFDIDLISATITMKWFPTIITRKDIGIDMCENYYVQVTLSAKNVYRWYKVLVWHAMQFVPAHFFIEIIY